MNIIGIINITYDWTPTSSSFGGKTFKCGIVEIFKLYSQFLITRCLIRSKAINPKQNMFDSGDFFNVSKIKLYASFKSLSFLKNKNKISLYYQLNTSTRVGRLNN